jgi:hypothetical protein
VPLPTPLPDPIISCPATVANQQNFRCTWTNPWVGGATSTQWYANGSKVGDPVGGYMQLTPGQYSIQLYAVRGGVTYFSNTADVTVNP